MATLSVARKARQSTVVSPPALPTYTVEMVGPDLARIWLGYNSRNRHIKQATIAAYARDMAAGKWMLRGDAIEFSAEPALLNGQHRLHAIVESGVTVPILVGRNVDEAVQAVTDTPAVRTFADQLVLASVPNAKTVAAVARRGLMWDRGIVSNVGGAYKPTHSEMAAWISRNPEVHDAAEIAVSVRSQIRLPGSVSGLAYIVFRRIDRDEANDFLGRLADGAGLPAGHPLLAFRARWIKERDLGGRVPETEILALLFIAWNHTRSGNSISKLQLPKAGLTSSNFPIPR
jgi:hypothetical protein